MGWSFSKPRSGWFAFLRAGEGAFTGEVSAGQVADAGIPHLGQGETAVRRPPGPNGGD